MTQPGPSRLLVALAFFAIYFIWGTTYLASLFGLESFKPFVLSFFRYSTAAVILLIWCSIKKIALPPKKNIPVLAISGILMNVGGSGLVVVAEQYINSGHAAVLIATEPLMFLLLDKRNWKTYFSNKWIITGLLLGFAGLTIFSVYTVSGNAVMDSQMADPVKGSLLVLLSAVFWVVGSLFSRNKATPGTSNLANVTVQLGAAGITSAILALAFGEFATFRPAEVTIRAWSGVLYLTLMGSLIAYMAFTWLITIRPPAIVSTHTYVNPLVAVLFGWILAKEQIVWMQIAGLIMALTGVLLTNIKKGMPDVPNQVAHEPKPVTKPN